MADEVQWYSVPAVARMLGISERAIRGRIERGSLTAELTDGQWRIPISALPNDKPEGGTLGGTSRGTPNDVSGMGGMADGMDTAPLVDARQQAQADAVLQRVLAPFIEQLTVTNQELGQVRAERDAALMERDRLRDELGLVRSSVTPQAGTVTIQELPQDVSQVSQQSGQTEHADSTGEKRPQHELKGFWQRLFGL